jgi:hypothetical protein
MLNQKLQPMKFIASVDALDHVDKALADAVLQSTRRRCFTSFSKPETAY